MSAKSLAGFDNKLSHIADFLSPKAISRNRSLRPLDTSFRICAVLSVNSEKSPWFGSSYAVRNLHEISDKCCQLSSRRQRIKRKSYGKISLKIQFYGI